LNLVFLEAETKEAKMKAMKINKIAAIGLLMVLVVGFGEATKE